MSDSEVSLFRMHLVHLLGTAILACTITWITNWLALIPWRRAKDSHWTERARALFPARVAAIASLWSVPVNLVLAQLLLFSGETPHWLLLGLAGWVGALVGTRAFDREVSPTTPFKNWLHEASVASLLRLSSWLLLLSAIALMPAKLGWETAVVTILYIILQFTLTWRILPLLKRLRLIDPPPERLSNLVSRVSERMEIRVDKVWMMHSSSANAFALPFSRELVFNKPLLNLLTDEELEAVCAHELGHLTESATSLVIRVLGSLLFLPWIFLTPLMGTFGFLGILAAGLAMIGLLRGFQAMSRRLEQRADSIAHGQEINSGTYALALEKIHEAAQNPAVFPQRETTHPHLYDRLIAAGVTPGYPRPKPAEAMALHGSLLSGLFGILIVLYAIQTSILFK